MMTPLTQAKWVTSSNIYFLDLKYSTAYYLPILVRVVVVVVVVILYYLSSLSLSSLTASFTSEGMVVFGACSGR
jgi:hypothetical protein